MRPITVNSLLIVIEKQKVISEFLTVKMLAFNSKLRFLPGNPVHTELIIVEILNFEFSPIVHKFKMF